MPRFSQYSIRTALIHLALGTTLGAIILADKGLHIAPWLWTFKASHVHLLLIGTMVQLACGVAVWILPRLNAKNDRGNLYLVWISYGMLNGGVILGVSYTPLTALSSITTNWIAILNAICYLCAAITFIGHLWQRVIPFRTLPRPSVEG